MEAQIRSVFFIANLRRVILEWRSLPTGIVSYIFGGTEAVTPIRAFFSYSVQAFVGEYEAAPF